MRKTIKVMLLRTLLVLRYYLDLFIDKLFGLYYDSKREYIPKIKNTLVLESASCLANKIRTKKITAEEVVQSFIQRINEVNKIINAVVDQRFEQALEEAKKIDADIANGIITDKDFAKKPFLGVPFTSKESTAAEGLSWTFGLVKRRGKKANFNATCLESVKKAGGILLGVTNVPQINLWCETSNPLFGLTRNPYNTTRNVGGSSGGESAIIAASGSPLGIGTDIGGSIRIPAFTCGIFGHKITCNLVNSKGLTYRNGTETDSILSTGPLTKYAEDLIPFIKVLVGEENTKKLKLNEPLVPANKIKVYYITDPEDRLASPIREEMRAILLKAVNYLSKVCSNNVPVELEFENLKYQFKLWSYCMKQEKSNFRNDINNREGEVNAIAEIFKHFTIGGDFTTATILNLINTFIKGVDPTWAQETLNNLKKALLSKLDENSILLYPSAPFPANYHHTALLRPYNFSYFAIWNALKFPVTQVPMGLSKDGLPLGIQVVAAPFQDRLSITIAKELEKGFGGYVPPSIVANN